MARCAVSAVEHSAVLAARPDAVVIPVTSDGVIDLAGLGAAALIAGDAMAADAAHARRLADTLLGALRVPFAVHGCTDRRWPGNLNLGFPGVAVPLLPHLPKLALSAWRRSARLMLAKPTPPKLAF